MATVVDTAFVEILPQFQGFSNQVRAEVDGAARQMSTGVSGAMQRAGASIQSAGQQMAQVGGQLTRNVTLPLVAVGGAAFKTASDFEATMTRIVGLVGVPREQVQAWEDDVRSLAVEFGKSGTEAAEALFYITSAGLEGDVAMQALEASLKASAVGLGDTATIADLATSAINAYGSDVLSASDATDVLTAAVREGKLEPDQLAASMGRVLPVASSMGVSFDEVGAAMAAMSRTGTNAAEASTQLRGILTSILKPTKQARDALEEMGLSADGLRTQIREEGLLSTLETLVEAFDGNDDAITAVFGNVRALTGVMDLMGANAEDTAEIFDALSDSSGSLDDAFAETAQTAQFQLQVVLAELKDLLLEIGQAVLPVAVEAMSVLRDAIMRVREAWEGLTPEQQKLIIQIAGIAAAVGPVLVAAGGLVATFGSLVGVIGRLLPLFGAMLGPIGLIITLVGGLIAASPELRAALSDAFEQILEALKPLLPVLTDLVQSLMPPLVEVVKSLVDALVPLVVVVVELVAELAMALAPVLVAIVEALVPIVEMVAEFAQELLISLQPAIEAVSEVLVEVATVLGEAIALILPIVIDLVLQLLEALLPLIPPLLDIVIALLPLVELLAELIAVILPPLIEGFVALLEPVVDLTVVLAEFLAVVAEVVVEVIVWLVELFTNWDEKWEEIKDALSAAWDFIKDTVSNALAAVGDFIRDGFARIGRFAVDGVEWMRDQVRRRLDQVREFFAALPGRVMSAIRSLPGRLRSMASDMMNGFRDRIRDRFNAVRDFFRGIPDRIRSAIPNPLNILRQAGRNIISGLINGITSRVSAVRDTIGGVVSTIRNMLPFSPAREGPLRDHPIDAAGRAIMMQLTEGLRSRMSMLRGQVREVAGAIDFGGDRAVPGLLTSSGMPQLSSRFDRQGGDTAQRQQDQRFVLELKSDGSDEAELLLRTLSKAVRVRGGDVQKVLGVTR